MKARFDIKDMGKVDTFLGMSVDVTQSKVVMHQEQYIQEIITRFGMQNTNLRKTPMELNSKLRVQTGECKDKKLQSEYRQKVGALLYLAQSTLPSIAYTVKELSRHLQHPAAQHMRARPHVTSRFGAHVHL